MSFFSAEENSQQIDTHWMSESGIIDVFVMLGPRPHDVFKQYAALTGPAALPPVRTCDPGDKFINSETLSSRYYVCPE